MKQTSKFLPFFLMLLLSVYACVDNQPKQQPEQQEVKSFSRCNLAVQISNDIKTNSSGWNDSVLRHLEAQKDKIGFIDSVFVGEKLILKDNEKNIRIEASLICRIDEKNITKFGEGMEMYVYIKNKQVYFNAEERSLLEETVKHRRDSIETKIKRDELTQDSLSLAQIRIKEKHEAAIFEAQKNRINDSISEALFHCK